VNKNTKVISAYPCCGKSYIFDNVDSIFRGEEEDIIILDSDSSLFSWIQENGEKKRNLDFPKNYIKHIKKNIGKADYIFVSSHKEVREALSKANIKFTLVVPEKKLLNDWMIRMYNRGNDDNFINLQIDNWDKWLNEIDEEKGTYSKIIRLGRNQYLADVLHKC
jgi:hypothetical protein